MDARWLSLGLRVSWDAYRLSSVAELNNEEEVGEEAEKKAHHFFLALHIGIPA
jgi:hypothetical protein